MELIKPGKQFDFMRYRAWCIGISGVLVALSLLSFVYPGPNYGIDFRGGLELQVGFRGAVPAGELRKTLEDLGYKAPDVVAVGGSTREYIIRVAEASSLSPAAMSKLETDVRGKLGGDDVSEFRVSPAGDKVTVRLTRPLVEGELESAFASAGTDVRHVTRVGSASDLRFEVQLKGLADRIVAQLGEKFRDRAPDAPSRVEWVGPKAGAQLRDAAIKSMLYAIAFIMVYVAFRFDLRFAPGGIVALAHDAILMLGAYVLLRKEINLSTVAAVLTIIGYSINDTIVVYDRIRENMARMRDKSLRELVNISTSQMLGRTIITSLVTAISVVAFFVFGTSVIKDLAFALFFGIVVGSYSTIYIAAPFTEWMDRRFFARKAAQA